MLAKNLPSYVGLEDAIKAYEDQILGGGLSVDDLREYVFGRKDKDTSKSHMRVSIAVGQDLNDLRVDGRAARVFRNLRRARRVYVTGDFRG